MKKIADPPTPYLGHIIGNFTDGKTVTIQGMVLPPAQRIVISFQTGKSPTHGDDIALQLTARLLEGTVVRNSVIEGVSGTEESFGHYPLIVGKRFVITVTNQRPKYIIKINDSSIEFKHRLPSSRVNHLSIQGDVKLYEITYETNTSYDNFTPLYDDPPPPYSEFPETKRMEKDDTDCMLKTALPALAVGTGIGAVGASLLANRSKGQQETSKKKPTSSYRPAQAQEQQQQSTSAWNNLGAIGAGVAAVGVLAGIGGLLYSLAKGSDDDDKDKNDK